MPFLKKIVENVSFIVLKLYYLLFKSSFYGLDVTIVIAIFYLFNVF